MPNPFTPTKALSTGMLADATVHAGSTYNGTLDTARMLPLKGPLTPTADSVYADLTPADYSGAAASAAITWGTPYSGSSGPGEVTSDLKTFKATADTPTNSVSGVALFTGATGSEKLLGVWVFDSVVSILKSGDGFGFVGRILAGSAITGDGVILN